MFNLLVTKMTKVGLGTGARRLMEAKLFRSPAVFFRRQIQDLPEVSGGDFELQLPAGSPLQPAVTLPRLLLKTNPKHKLEINLARSDKYWV